MRDHLGCQAAIQFQANLVNGCLQIKDRHMKDTFYFSHDYNTRADEKIKKLIKKHGMEGYGIFWSIVEDLYNNANVLQIDCESIAYDLRSDIEIVKSIINDFGLFVCRDDMFYSESIKSRLEERMKKAESARSAATKRWKKDANASTIDADASESYAIKKRKESKDINEYKMNKYIKKREMDNKSLSSALKPISEVQELTTEEEEKRFRDLQQVSILEPESQEENDFIESRVTNIPLGKLISKLVNPDMESSKLTTESNPNKYDISYKESLSQDSDKLSIETNKGDW
jgi:hypothetical protein